MHMSSRSLHKAKSKGGRPLLPEHQARRFKKTTNLNAGELEKLASNAQKAGLSISQYLRSSALAPNQRGISVATTAALNAIACELNAIAGRAAGAGNPLSEGEAAELVGLNQALVKRLAELKRTLESQQ